MRRSVVACAATILAAAGGSLALAAPSQAFELRGAGVGLTSPGSVSNPTPDAPELRAGAHPDVTVDLQFPVTEDANGTQTPTESVKDIDVDLPRGLIFNPTAVPRCTGQQLSLDYSAKCPLASQIGTAYVGLSGFEQAFPIYNMVPPPGVPAQFGFNVVKTTIRIDGAVRSGGDYGLSARVRGISQALPLTSTRIVLWGVPADAVHDADRNSLTEDNEPVTGPANIPVRPLTSNPGRCTGAPSAFSARASSWASPAFSSPVVASNQRIGGAPLTMTDCGGLPFEPSVSVQPTTTAPDSPTGLDVTVSVPQSDSPQVRSSAHLKDLAILLPEGMNVNPSAADGLTACSPSQIALASESAASCPDASALGSVAIDTPLLEEPLRGRAYLASQNDNPFGTTLAVYLVAEGSGVRIKLAGRIDADPASGRLRVTFSDTPELPFSTLRVSLDGGQRAPLTTPPTCGPQNVQADATPWSGTPTKALTDGFAITCTPGLGAFAPSFLAGTASPTAGRFSPLSISVTRPDGQAHLRGLTFQLPPGLLAKISGVPLCGEAQAAAGTCDARTRVGAATVTAGAGSQPFPLKGEVFLTGPYKGAPYGLSTRVRAVAGPLDLGTVVVRQALHIDPEDTHVTAVSDPLPTILSGIPIRLRTLDVVLDRPGFTVNPTSCGAQRIGGTLGSAGGATAAVSTRFRVGGCQALPLSPKLSLRMVGKGRTLRKGGHAGIRARMTLPPSQSGLRRVEVQLPLTLALDADNARGLCESAAGSARDPKCPASSKVGTARVKSPLLPLSLTGPVYLVKGVRTTAGGKQVRTLPKLVLPLKGNGVQITLRANSLVRKNQLVAQFDRIPDAPVSRFDLTLNGGRRGILAVTRDACRFDRRAGLRFSGHSGRERTGVARMTMDCRGQRK